MVIGSHNAWSYLPPKKWWMKILSFTARCQRKTIKEQYDMYNVRCFDLRIRFNDDRIPVICHGLIEYEYSYNELIDDLKWLQSKGDVSIRLLLDLRSVPKNKWQKQKQQFNSFYNEVMKGFFPTFTYYVGRSLPDYEKVIRTIQEGKILEYYSSVSDPKYIDDWIPILYAKLNNKNLKKKDFGDDYILLIDFVDI